MKRIFVVLLLSFFQGCIHGNKVNDMHERKTTSHEVSMDNKEKDTSLVKEKSPIPPKPELSKINPVLDKPSPCTSVNGVVLKDYIGKEVHVLLDAIKLPYHRYTFSQEPPSKLSSCIFEYDSVLVEIYVDKLKYLERFNREGNWDINLFKKEKISDVSCEYCVNGCR